MIDRILYYLIIFLLLLLIKLSINVSNYLLYDKYYIIIIGSNSRKTKYNNFKQLFIKICRLNIILKNKLLL